MARNLSDTMYASAQAEREEMHNFLARHEMRKEGRTLPPPPPATVIVSRNDEPVPTIPPGNTRLYEALRYWK